MAHACKAVLPRDRATDLAFDACIAFTRKEEGGYVEDPRDPGNWTSGLVGSGRLIGSNMGVGAPVLAQWFPDANVTSETMRTLSADVYAAIARTNYWDPMSCAYVQPGIDLMLFDFGWNRGIKSSIRLLQSILDVVEDGICGRKTLLAANAREKVALIQAMYEAQEVAYRDLDNFAIYGRGWLARTNRRHAAALLRAEHGAALSIGIEVERSLTSTSHRRGRPAGRIRSHAVSAN